MNDFTIKETYLFFRMLILDFYRSILIITISFFIIGIIYAFSLEDIYRSDALLIRSEDSGITKSSQGDISSLLNLSSGGDRIELLSEQIVFSRDFFEYFALKRLILPNLIAVKSYDKSTSTILYDESRYDSKKKSWIGEDPTSKLLLYHPAFLEHFLFVPDTQTKTAVLNVFHQSPMVAREWANWFIEDLNMYISNIEIENASSLLDYLELKNLSITSTDLKKQIGNLMLVSIGKMALAERSYEFAYEVLDKPNLPVQKTSPSRLFIIIFFIISGFLIAISRAVIYRKI